MDKLEDRLHGKILARNNNNPDECYSNVPCWMKSYFWDVDIIKIVKKATATPSSLFFYTAKCLTFFKECYFVACRFREYHRPFQPSPDK